MKVTIAGDEEYDKEVIIPRFMEELCRRDNAVNMGEVQSSSNTFIIEEIWNKALSNSYRDSSGLEFVKKFIR